MTYILFFFSPLRQTPAVRPPQIQSITERYAENEGRESEEEGGGERQKQAHFQLETGRHETVDRDACRQKGEWGKF